MTATPLLPADDPQALARALAALARGELVALPTDTVYGVAARLDRPDGVRRLYTAKGRPEDRPIPVLVSRADLLADLTADPPAGAAAFAARFWPGPLTIALPRSPRVPDLVTAGRDTVGLRMPDHPVALALIDACGGALAVTSANRSGEPSLDEPAAVATALDGRLALVLDGGRAPGGLASTVIELTAAGPTVLREGPLDAATLSAAWAAVQADLAGRG